MNQEEYGHAYVYEDEDEGRVEAFKKISRCG